MSRRVRWFAGVAAAIALALVAAWLARDAIVRDRANAVLGAQGFEVVDVHLASIGPRRAALARLELVQDDGTRYLVEGLDLPLRLPGKAPLAIHADSLRVVPPAATGPMPIARLLGAMLSLPDTLPRTRIAVDRVEIDGWPVIGRFEWRAAERGQEVRFDGPVGSVSLDLAPTSDTIHVGLLTVSAGDATLVSMPLEIAREPAAYVLDADLTADLEGVAPLLAPVLPGALSGISGELVGTLELTLGDDPATPPRGLFTLAPLEPIGARYRDAVGRDIDLRLALPEALRVAFPAGPGSLDVEAGDVRLSASGEGVGRLEAALRELACEPGRCSLRLAVDAPRFTTSVGRVEEARLELPFEARWDDGPALETRGPWRLRAAVVEASGWTVEALDVAGEAGTSVRAGGDGSTLDAAALSLRAASVRGPAAAARAVTLSASLIAAFDEAAWRIAAQGIEIRASSVAAAGVSAQAASVDAGLRAEGDGAGVVLTTTAPMVVEATGVSAPGVAAERISLDGPEGARVRLGDAWAASAPSASLALAGVSSDAAPGRGADLIVSLGDLSAGTGERMQADIAAAAGDATLTLGGHAVRLPRFSGRVEGDGEALRARLTLGEPVGAVEGRIELAHAFGTGSGRAELADAMLRFDRRSLAAWLGDAASGSGTAPWDAVAGSAALAGQVDWGPAGVDARIDARVSDVAGFWDDIAVSGVATELTARYADGALRVEPLEARIALVEVGFPVEHVVARVRPDLAQGELAVERLDFDALGGRIAARAFTYALAEELNVVVLEPQSVQLQFIVTLASLDALEVTGSLSGALPLMIGPRGLRMDGGRLVSDGDGGVIRYGSGAAASGNAGLDMVQRALSNFHYASLTSDVNYTLDGDLVLKMRLEGTNPDMDPLQPVILNLAVENNVPQLLRSLQATRAIEEVLGEMGR